MTNYLGTVLLSKRLRLRAPDNSDLAFTLDMYSRPEVMRYIGSGEVQTTRDQALHRIERYRSQFGAATGVWLVERSDDDARLNQAAAGASSEATEATEGSERSDSRLGFALMKPIPFSEGIAAEQPDIEIGWHLHPSAWGAGFASEAAQALVDHARAGGLQRLVAVTNPANAASQAVARRLGMTYQGPTDRYYNTSCELFTLEL